MAARHGRLAKLAPVSTGLILSAKPAFFVCLAVNKMTQKVLNRF